MRYGEDGYRGGWDGVSGLRWGKMVEAGGRPKGGGPGERGERNTPKKNVQFPRNEEMSVFFEREGEGEGEVKEMTLLFRRSFILLKSSQRTCIVHTFVQMFILRPPPHSF